MKNQITPHPALKLILWSALFASNFIFIALAMGLPPAEPAIAESGSFSMSLVLFIAGCSSVVMSFVIPKLVKPNPQIDLETTKFILGLALNESASIFAFIIAFIFQDQKTAYALFAISIVGYLIKFPRGNRIKSEDSGKNNSLNVE